MQFIYAGIILFGCAFIQTIAGFSFALFAVPFLLLCGFDLPGAVVTSMAGSIIQRSLLVHKCRKSIDWTPLFKMLPWSVIGLVIGVVALKQAANLDKDIIKLIFGIIILVAVAFRLFIRVKPRDSIPFHFSALASFFSGILNGFANIGGPPLVLWLLAHKWPREQLRATIPAFTLLMVPIQLVLFGISFGIPILVQTGQGLLFFPVILAAVYAGNVFSSKLSAERTRMIIIVLLAITGISYIVFPLLKKYGIF